MIELVERSMCNGCMACYNACPKSAISIQTDIGGFYYPLINRETCINCGICNKVCTVYHSLQESRYSNPKVYAAYSKSVKTRLESTSGGVFTELANYIFILDGYVSGAIYGKDYLVKHIVSKDRTMLPRLRSSKYIQSNSASIYTKIKERLIQGEKVLICGTPCQIKALYNVLGKEYDNLYTLDFICRGVNSPRVYLKYIHYLEEKYHSKVVAVKFKDKKYGWSHFSTKIRFQNNKIYYGERYDDSFMRGYLEFNYFMRESCTNCMYRAMPRVSDITLADFWGIDKVAAELNQNMGTSVVMVNSLKGQKLFHEIKSTLVWMECSFDDVVSGNSALLRSPILHIRSKEFMRDMDVLEFKQLIEYYIPKKLLVQRVIGRITREGSRLKLHIIKRRMTEA